MSDDERLRRRVGAGLLACGSVATAGFALLHEYADELGGTAVWLAALGGALGTALVGLALWLRGDRLRRLGAAWTLTVLAAALGASALAPQPSVAAGALWLSAAALLVVFTGRLAPLRALAGTVFLALASLLVVYRAVQQRRLPPLRGPAVVFEVARVDDRDDPLAAIEALPEGAELGREDVAGSTLHFLRFSGPPGTPFAALQQAADRWLKSNVGLPAGLRVAWRREPERPGMVIRSYVLRGPSFVTSADVLGAELVTAEGEAYVSLTLGDAATARMRDVTRAHVGRRLSILLDGVVQVAPLVAAEIAERHVRLSLGPDVSREEAHGIVTGIRGGLRHGPKELAQRDVLLR